jgi:hypothetical protein
MDSMLDELEAKYFDGLVTEPVVDREEDDEEDAVWVTADGTVVEGPWAEEDAWAATLEEGAGAGAGAETAWAATLEGREHRHEGAETAWAATLEGREHRQEGAGKAWAAKLEEA